MFREASSQVRMRGSARGNPLLQSRQLEVVPPTQGEIPMWILPSPLLVVSVVEVGRPRALPPEGNADHQLAHRCCGLRAGRTENRLVTWREPHHVRGSRPRSLGVLQAMLDEVADRCSYGPPSLHCKFAQSPV
jgi:hypothetical protein